LTSPRGSSCDDVTNPNGPASNWPFVRGVIGMEGVPLDDRFDWRAIEAVLLAAAAGERAECPKADDTRPKAAR
jgi:hypothetical protein